MATPCHDIRTYFQRELFLRTVTSMTKSPWMRSRTAVGMGRRRESAEAAVKVSHRRVASEPPVKTTISAPLSSPSHANRGPSVSSRVLEIVDDGVDFDLDDSDDDSPASLSHSDHSLHTENATLVINTEYASSNDLETLQNHLEQMRLVQEQEETELCRIDMSHRKKKRQTAKIKNKEKKKRLTASFAATDAKIAGIETSVQQRFIEIRFLEQQIDSLKSRTHRKSSIVYPEAIAKILSNQVSANDPLLVS